MENAVTSKQHAGDNLSPDQQVAAVSEEKPALNSKFTLKLKALFTLMHSIKCVFTICCRYVPTLKFPCTEMSNLYHN